MKKLLVYAAGIMILNASCKKDEPQPVPPPQPPAMEYFYLNNREIKPNSPGFPVDFNDDGRNDIAFTTLLVGDPIEQMDKLQFLVMSNIGVNLPVNTKEEIPVMSKGEMIVIEDFRGYQWFELASIMLVQKNISLMQDPFWTGHWKNATHKYIPFQVLKEGKKYNGWIEISVNTAQDKIILHNAAISKVAGAAVRAGS